MTPDDAALDDAALHDAALDDAALENAVERESRRHRRLQMRDLGLAVLTPVVLLVLWELAAMGGVLDRRLFTGVRAESRLDDLLADQ